MTRWQDPRPVNVAALASLNLHPLVAQTLMRRGINSPEEAEAFLHPDTTPPAQFPDIDKATEIILAAIRNQEKICVWGDFDVDGQTSTALLVQALRALDADVVYYIPIRGKESHGVHIETLAPIIDNGAKLILTCDTGITAHDAIDYANSRNIPVIITDHHDLGETLPNAKAIVNPKLLPPNHPLENLAGVGVAYKLAEALFENSKLGIGKLGVENTPQFTNLPTPDSLLDLVALGLIADVALLKNETRALAQKGIQALRKTERLGLKAIAEISGTNLETLTEETIGFTFAPRLNALGRLGDANPAVELLLTQDPARARDLAEQIEGLNAKRRLLTSQVYEAAEAQLKADPNLLADPAIVLSHPNWPGGVVGIVANRLVDRYHKPAILLTESEDGILRGSARSVEGLHVTEAIAANKDLLLSFGGHPMAAGMALQKDNLAAFRKGLGKAIEKQLGEVVREEPSLQIDAWLELDETTLELASALEALAPFGAGNPSLTFASRNVTLKAVAKIGKNREHLRLNIADENDAAQSVLWWNSADEILPEAGTKFDIAYSLRASTFRGQKQIALQFIELRAGELGIGNLESGVESRKSKVEIRDFRLQPSTFDLRPSTLIWAEGSDKAKGVSRFELRQADEFAIYTTPPSPVELRRVLEIVKPKTIYIFAVSPAEEKTEDFINRLAGLCKYALKNYDGKATTEQFATAMASRENAIQIGLEWLNASGQLTVKFEENKIQLSTEKRERNPYLQAELFVALKGILNEAAAYRKYFATTGDLDGLMKTK